MKLEANLIIKRSGSSLRPRSNFIFAADDDDDNDDDDNDDDDDDVGEHENDGNNGVCFLLYLDLCTGFTIILSAKSSFHHWCFYLTQK